MIVERSTPTQETLSALAGGTTGIIDLLNLESVFVHVRNGSGVAGTFSVFGMTAVGGVLWTIGNAIALGIGQTAAFQLASDGNFAGLAAAMAPAAGAYSTFLALPPAMQINAVGINLTINLVKRER